MVLVASLRAWVMGEIIASKRSVCRRLETETSITLERLFLPTPFFVMGEKGGAAL